MGPDLEKPRRNKANGVWGTSETEGESCGVRYRQHIPPQLRTKDTKTGEETTYLSVIINITMLKSVYRGNCTVYQHLLHNLSY